jgi:hypothetical protein
MSSISASLSIDASNCSRVITGSRFNTSTWVNPDQS